MLRSGFFPSNALCDAHGSPAFRFLFPSCTDKVQGPDFQNCQSSLFRWVDMLLLLRVTTGTFLTNRLLVVALKFIIKDLIRKLGYLVISFCLVRDQ